MDRDRILERVRSFLGAATVGVPVEATLFGSWARREERRSSDIDIALLPKGPVPAGFAARVKAAFEESSIPQRVEIVDLTEAGQELRAEVLREGIRWTL